MAFFSSFSPDFKPPFVPAAESSSESFFDQIPLIVALLAQNHINNDINEIFVVYIA
jgi:hypothetical protein